MGNGCCNRTSVQTEVDRLEIAPQVNFIGDPNQNKPEFPRSKKGSSLLPEASGE